MKFVSHMTSAAVLSFAALTLAACGNSPANSSATANGDLFGFSDEDTSAGLTCPADYTLVKAWTGKDPAILAQISADAASTQAKGMMTIGDVILCQSGKNFAIAWSPMMLFGRVDLAGVSKAYVKNGEFVFEATLDHPTKGMTDHVTLTFSKEPGTKEASIHIVSDINSPGADGFDNIEVLVEKNGKK